jgi:hypothetical protein
MLVTVPVGLNAGLDRVLLSEDTPFGETRAMRRSRAGNRWTQVEPATVAGATYSRLGFRANAILIATLDTGQG